MLLWLTILASALGAGIVVLHGFNCWTADGSQMLETYQQLLTAAKRKRQQGDGEEMRS